jgi:hypothetical protein
VTDPRDSLASNELAALEFKSDASDRNGIREAICALANNLGDHRSGTLPIGARDDGVLYGLSVDDKPLQHAVRLDRPVKVYDRFRKRIPGEFARSVLDVQRAPLESADSDPSCLATLRNYRSLMPLAQDARKPMFDLRAFDGAVGSTGRLVSICFREFEAPATSVLHHAGIEKAA